MISQLHDFVMTRMLYAVSPFAFGMISDSSDIPMDSD